MQRNDLHPHVLGIFEIGLIAAAGIMVAQECILNMDNFGTISDVLSIADPVKVFLFAAVFIAKRKLKWHPVCFIAIGAVVGILLGF